MKNHIQFYGYIMMMDHGQMWISNVAGGPLTRVPTADIENMIFAGVEKNPGRFRFTISKTRETQFQDLLPEPADVPVSATIDSPRVHTKQAPAPVRSLYTIAVDSETGIETPTPPESNF